LAKKIGLQEGDVMYEFDGHTVDVYGDATVSWSPDKVSILDLISRLKIGQHIDVVVYRHGHKKELSFNFDLMPEYPIRRRYPDYEKVDYEMIGGMVVMQLANNHFSRLLLANPYLMRYKKVENKADPVLVIAHILRGSEIHQQRNVFSGDVVTQVNGIEVTTLAEFRQVLRKQMKSDTLTVKTFDDVYAVLPLKKILVDELWLSKAYSYPVSQTVQDLVKEIGGQ